VQSSHFKVIGKVSRLYRGKICTYSHIYCDRYADGWKTSHTLDCYMCKWQRWGTWYLYLYLYLGV